MRIAANSLVFLLLSGMILLLPSCSGRAPVRHLASDACLLLPDQTTKQEILSYLGPPAETRSGSEGEVWVYYEVKKDFLRTVPLVGERLGQQKYDVVTVTFAGDVVRTCSYRSLSGEEFEMVGSDASSGS